MTTESRTDNADLVKRLQATYADVAAQPRDNRDLEAARMWLQSGFLPSKDAVTDLVAKIEALRAVLGPLLDDALVERNDGDWRLYDECRYCGGSNLYSWRARPDGVEHAPDCPTLRADELMGRA